MSEMKEDLSDEEMRKLLKPMCTLEQVESAVQKSYGSDIKLLKALDSYDDQNFLAVRDGINFLVKVHNGWESRNFCDAFEACGRNYNDCSSVIHLQTAIMDHLSIHGVPTSRAELCDNVPLSIHSLPVQSDNHSPCKLVVKLMTWVPGRPMSSLSQLPLESLYSAGRFLGTMRKALDKMDVSKHSESAERFHAWDGKQTSHIQDFLWAIEDPSKRSMVQSILASFQSRILDSGINEQFDVGIIQGDFNDANIIMDENFSIAGVIDFGDTVESWKVLDLSVAMAYALMTVYGKQGRSISAAAALLRGYCQVCDLTDLELEHLHLLICCRVACSATLGAYSLKQDPGNHYLLLHAQPAWNALDFFWGHDENYRCSMADLLKSIFLKARDKVSEPFVTDLQFPDPNFHDITASHRAKFNQLLPSKRLKLSEEKPLVTFVTGNKKKLEEVQRLLGEDLPFRITNAKVDLPELQGDTIEIAREKCLEAARQIGNAVITEDTSLCFTALNDLPGPYIKWFLEKCGHDGLNKMLAAFEDKSAYAQTVVAFCSGPGKEVIIFDGRTKGRIVPARGSLEFGWDPIFEPDEGNGFTYAEMTKDAKDAISHRSRAMAQLKSYFLSNSDAIASLS